MGTMSGRRFHVVCHDCSFESVVSDATEANRLITEHTETEAHATRYARVE